MRKTHHSLANAREELVEIHAELTRLQKQIEVVRDSVGSSLISIFGEQRPAFTGLDEVELIERIATSVATRLGTPNTPQVRDDRRYIREKAAAAYLGVSVASLRNWRSTRSPSGPPFTRISRMVMYSVKELERYMEVRTVESR